MGNFSGRPPHIFSVEPSPHILSPLTQVINEHFLSILFCLVYGVMISFKSRKILLVTQWGQDLCIEK